MFGISFFSYGEMQMNLNINYFDILLPLTIICVDALFFIEV